MNKKNINYIIALSLFIVAIAAFINSKILSGVALILASLLFINKIDDIIESLIKTEFSSALRYSMVFTLIIIAVVGFFQEKIVIKESSSTTIKEEILEYKMNDSFVLNDMNFVVNKIILQKKVGDVSNGSIIGDVASGIFVIINLNIKGVGYLPRIKLISNNTEILQDNEAKYYINSTLKEFVNGSLNNQLIFDIPENFEDLKLKLEDENAGKIVIVDLG